MNEDEVRELRKVRATLEWVDRHFDAEAQMNAAKHMNDRVIPNPLAAAAATAFNTIHQLIERYDRGAEG